MKCPPGARCWHLVRAVRRRWFRPARKKGAPRPPRRFLDWEIRFNGQVTGARVWMRLEALETFGYLVKGKGKAGA